MMPRLRIDTHSTRWLLGFHWGISNEDCRSGRVLVSFLHIYIGPFCINTAFSNRPGYGQPD
jgi:hypothetical protein